MQSPWWSIIEVWVTGSNIQITLPCHLNKRKEKKEKAAFGYMYAANTTPNQQNEKMFGGLYTSSWMKAWYVGSNFHNYSARNDT